MPLTKPTLPNCPTHVHTPFIPPKVNESKYTSHERIRISSDTPSLPPYKWICKLKLGRSASHDFYRLPSAANSNLGSAAGTAFLVNIPGSTRCTLLTSAHNLFHDGNYIPEITITFPGGGKLTMKGNERVFKIPEDFKNNEKKDHKNILADYGVILLPEKKDPNICCGFGLAAMMLDRELLETNLSVFGYPTNETMMWGSGGRTQSVDRDIIRYLLQTTEGQSGSPVFIWYRGFWTVVGIHGRHEKRAEWMINSGIRLNPAVMDFVVHAIEHPLLGVTIMDGEEALGISEGASRKPGEYGTLHASGTGMKWDLIPVQSYPESTGKCFSANEWVVTSADYRDTVTALCVDPCRILEPAEMAEVESDGKAKMLKKGVVACGHLNSTAILRRATETVNLKDDGTGVCRLLDGVRFPGKLGVTIRTNGGKLPVVVKKEELETLPVVKAKM